MPGNSSTPQRLPSVPLQPTVEKLTRNNHTIWCAQVLTALRGARLEGFLTGKKKAPTEELEEKEGEKSITVPNPEYEDWLAGDQQVLSFILASISKEILVRVVTAPTTAEAWKILEEQLTSQTRVSTINTRMALATTWKGTLSLVEYLAKMQRLGNNMAAAEKPLEDDDLVMYILAGLDEDYDSVVNSVLARPQAITGSKLAAQMLSFEALIDMCSGGSGSSANFVKRGHGPGHGRRGGRGGRFSSSGCGDHTSAGRGGHGGNNSDWPQCQVCHKIGHTTNRCWYRFDDDFVLKQKNVVVTTTSYTVDSDCYVDLGATDHITIEHDKLAVRDKYKDTEKVHTASGAGMEISYTGKSFIHTPHRKLQLCNVFHVPKATKNLMSIHRFSLDNNVFFEINPWFFLIKHRDTRSTLLRGRCRDGLYPLPASNPIKFSFGVNKPTLTRWHDR
jgi:hypothetical protein